MTIINKEAGKKKERSKNKNGKKDQQGS